LKLQKHTLFLGPLCRPKKIHKKKRVRERKKNKIEICGRGVFPKKKFPSNSNVEINT